MLRFLGTLGLVCLLAACGSEETPPEEGGGTDAGQTDAGSVSTDAGSENEGDAGVVNCVGQGFGVPCGENSICLDDLCQVSRCGDGYVDTNAGERCEDGNDIDGDGCTRCLYDCREDAHCDDENPCTVNTCVKEPGKQYCQVLPVEGSPECDLADGSEGICKAGQCVAAGCGNGVVEEGEDCDDGNDDDGDGCRNDCTWTCTSDADCNDGNACNGEETCDTATHTCQAGTPVTCDSPKAGCTGTCDPATGSCSWIDLDGDGVTCEADCNDADPAVYPGAFECKDGKDNDCDSSTPDATAPTCNCYRDVDGDGYAALNAATVSAVNCPDNYTRREPKSGDRSTYDCFEGSASVNPGQSSYFDKAYCTLFVPALPPNPGKCHSWSFDYNCDGTLTKRDTNLAIGAGCSLITLGGKPGCLGSGWVSNVPECGQSGMYRSCSLGFIIGGGATCMATTAERVQACR